MRDIVKRTGYIQVRQGEEENRILCGECFSIIIDHLGLNFRSTLQFGMAWRSPRGNVGYRSQGS